LEFDKCLFSASHDVDSMRDMRDALGALGPVNGDKPEITNLTLALTMVEKDDIIFLTSDGISDNFDPVVGKFAVPLTNKVQFSNHSVFLSSRTENSHLLAKRQNKNSISRKPQPNGLSESSTSCKLDTDSNSSIYQQSSQLKRRMFEESSSKGTRPVYLRSKTFIEPRLLSTDQKIKKTMLPQVTGAQRHQLTLLRMADLLMYGINGTLRPSTSAKQLCQLLVDFATCITSAKRKSLEQRELYYKVITSKDGCCKEIGFTKHQQKIARKRIVEGSTFALLPGKLDHASVVAFTVGSERVFNESYL
ncbi:PP2C-like domain-containing protein CG9801, partial [Malaya genurostris]|uniref:PP2C-like domain-containing protein CG9801 n=1 Tax=Malaya genurostris TaxID=325434 RepID=UPI0026F394F8